MEDLTSRLQTPTSEVTGWAAYLTTIGGVIGFAEDPELLAAEENGTLGPV